MMFFPFGVDAIAMIWIASDNLKRDFD